MPAPPTRIGSRRSTWASPTLTPIPRSPADAVDLRAAVVDAGEPLLADLVREPGVERAAQERPAEPPDGVGGDDADRGGRDADQEVGAAEDEHPDHDRALAPVGVGDDPRRHLEDEDGELHRRPDEHELERAEPELEHEEDGGDGERERPEERGDGLVEEPGMGGR